MRSLPNSVQDKFKNAVAHAVTSEFCTLGCKNLVTAWTVCNVALPGSLPELFFLFFFLFFLDGLVLF